ncbi:hypothetical protein SAMD00019534_026430 [Acytostelium subglobosum LB1]|uniref:hypothetical protein n=1 Tax=Acytostelium subglobosum LB1 TaxID=1410327 RepID=UPI0006447E2A|nr:hypothetical protein SAMD00019534_026430 [Acytostelium subglobosum LB1]GAM19468.1 hypothetical protein SAMD00019534_026430 [Acytostelium subglobosum LB1]|eukprot:XP_012757395.1 hypothetical protein SAMD00019534_026430 [Acytostelium subglobosum LB1]
MSLVCKRLFDQRHSFLHFITDHLRLYHNYSIDKVTLNSYKQIINNDTNNIPKTIYIYSHEECNRSNATDHQIYIGRMRYSDEWKIEVQAIPWIKSITFSDCELCPLHQEFWDSTVDFLKALRNIDGSSIPEIKFDQSTRPLHLYDIPLTELNIWVDYNYDQSPPVILPEMLPSTLTILNLYSCFVFEPRLDLTYLRSLKYLYMSNSNKEQPLKGPELPPSLTALEFRSSLSEINLNLSPSVTSLVIDDIDAEARIIVGNPQSLISLSTYSSSNISIKDYTSLREITLNYIEDDDALAHFTSDYLPCLYMLSIGFKNGMQPINLLSLPASLRKLAIKTQRPIDSLPSGIEWLRITFTAVFLNPVQVMSSIGWPKPSLIRTLKLESYYYELKDGDIPSSVTCLKLYQQRQPVSHTSLPPSIRKLLWYEGTKQHYLQFIQQLQSLLTVQRLQLLVGGKLFVLRRISATLFFHYDNFLIRSGFIDLDTLQSHILSIK